MNLFGWLLLGHLLADWLLQSDWMAVGKRQRFVTMAGFVHYTVYTTTIVVILWLFPAQTLTPYVTFYLGLIIFLSHWLIDGSDLVDRWMLLARQRNQLVVRLMVDQTLHLLVLGVVATVCGNLSNL